MGLFRIMDAFIAPFVRNELQEPLTEEELDNLSRMMPAWFLFALTWSVGATCDKPGRQRFDKRLRQAVLGASELSLPEGTLFPDGASCYDMVYDVETQAWVDWMATIPEYKVRL
jgi:dynein heavy chain